MDWVNNRNRKKLVDILDPNKIYNKEELTKILNYEIYFSDYKKLPGTFTNDKVKNLMKVLEIKNKLNIL